MTWMDPNVSKKMSESAGYPTNGQYGPNNIEWYRGTWGYPTSGYPGYTGGGQTGDSGGWGGAQPMPTQGGQYGYPGWGRPGSYDPRQPVGGYQGLPQNFQRWMPILRMLLGGGYGGGYGGGWGMGQAGGYPGYTGGREKVPPVGYRTGPEREVTPLPMIFDERPWGNR